MRRLGVLAGGQLPRDTESADALESLKGIYRRLISEGVCGPLKDVAPTTANYKAGENERIYRNSITTTSIDFPDQVSDGCGGYRLPRDASVISITDEFSNTTLDYIYEAGTRTWVPLDGLTLTSPALFARRDPNGLACMLAIELADEYGQQPSEIIARNAARWQMTLTYNWAQEDAPTRGVYF